MYKLSVGCQPECAEFCRQFCGHPETAANPFSLQAVKLNNLLAVSFTYIENRIYEKKTAYLFGGTMKHAHAIVGRLAIVAVTVLVGCATHRQLTQLEIDGTLANVDAMLGREQPDSAACLMNELAHSLPNDTMLLWRQAFLNHQVESVQGRRVASRALGRLIEISPQEPKYHYELAQVLVDQTREGPARTELYRTIELSPTDEQPYLALADLYLKPFFTKDEQDHADSAELVLKRLAARNPESLAGLGKLASIQAVRGEYDSATRYGELALEEDSTAVEPNLVMGYVKYQVRDFVKADRYFRRAIAIMDSESSAGYRSIEFLIPPHSMKPYRKMSPHERDSLETKFWEMTDIDPTTSVNERQVEHWARVWEANLCFSDPRQERIGWKTDMGETLIRLGRPDEKERRRMGMALTDISPVWYWQYRSVAFPCTLAFVDQMQSGNYTFPFPFRDNTGSYRLSSSQEVAYTNYLRKPQQSTVERERLPIGLASDIYQFRGDDSNAVVLEYLAIAKDDLTRSKDTAIQPLMLRQALRDTSGILLWQSDTTISIPDNVTPPAIDSLYEKRLLQYMPGTYELSAALEQAQENKFGLIRDTIRIESFKPDEIGMSDLLITSDSITGPSLGVFWKGGARGVPRPERVLSGSSPVYLYFEIYNLPFDIYRQSSYQVSYTMQLLKPTEVGVRGFLSKLAPRKKESITMTLHEVGTARDIPRFIALDIGELRPGTYLLTMQVTDQIFNRTVSRSKTLTIL